MTDHYAIVNPEELQPQRFVCANCGDAFTSAQALSGHQSIHSRGEKQPCPECGALYHLGPGMARHRQTTHGVAKANGQAPKPGGRPPSGSTPKRARKICPECHKPIREDNLKRHLRNVHGVTEQPPKLGVVPVAPVEEHEHPDLTEDDLFTAAVGMLFPSGVIPIAKVEALFKWRDATRRMIQDVYGGNWG